MAQEQQQADVSTILIVEDNALNQEFITEILSEYNADIHIANNGSEAVDKILEQNNHYDLVLMDIQMPVMDGLTATKIIRQRIDKEELPIIAVTAHASIADREKCLSAGMNNYVSKPINIKNIKSIISSFISVNRNKKNKSSMKQFELVDIDFSESLTRVDNDLLFLAELISKFCSKYDNTVSDIIKLLNDDKFTELENVIHGLKGISGNLALNNIYELTLQLEKCIKEKNIAEVNRLLASLELQLDKVKTASAELHTHIKNKTALPAQEKNDDAYKISDKVSELQKLLWENNFAALDAFSAIKQQLVIIADQGVIDDIEKDISSLKFQEAADKLHPFLSLIQVHHQL